MKKETIVLRYITIMRRLNRTDSLM
uniref:Uncharacterized protein n=1 Tax=Arundo donax TaxID=35708 RepID=A0A0A9B4E6_ARUDO